MNGTTLETTLDITPYFLKGKGPFPMIIVCPGGGYHHHADHEGQPVAEWLNRIGISALVLKYRVAPHQHPSPLKDAQNAIKLVRKNASKWNIDPKRVGILGFSAGGHVAASAGIYFEDCDKSSDTPIKYSSRPDLMILCYPVITMGKYAHEGSRQALLGKSPNDHLIYEMSLEEQVSGQTPPSFIWHTANDASVPVENSIQFAKSLSQFNVPYSLHVFESGRHGLGLAEENPEARQWPTLCENWLRSREFIG